MALAKDQEIDKSIADKVFSYSKILQNRTYEEMIKAIREKRNNEFCGVYELLTHDKLK